MEDRRWGDRTMYFLIGASIGATVALLFAPRSGQETREFIVGKAKDFREGIKDMYHRGKDKVVHEKEMISHAIQAGKQAYREEKQTKAPKEE